MQREDPDAARYFRESFNSVALVEDIVLIR